VEWSEATLQKPIRSQSHQISRSSPHLHLRGLHLHSREQRLLRHDPLHKLSGEASILSRGDETTSQEGSPHLAPRDQHQRPREERLHPRDLVRRQNGVVWIHPEEDERLRERDRETEIRRTHQSTHYICSFNIGIISQEQRNDLAMAHETSMVEQCPRYLQEANDNQFIGGRRRLTTLSSSGPTPASSRAFTR
jgi:hypothetical protein